MSKRLLLICQAEGLQVNETTLACLVEGTNGDIRAILGQLQMIRLRRTVLAYDDAKVQLLLVSTEMNVDLTLPWADPWWLDCAEVHCMPWSDTDCDHGHWLKSHGLS